MIESRYKGGKNSVVPFIKSGWSASKSGLQWCQFNSEGQREMNKAHKTSAKK
jgi:hypothetical protein